ncbi:hypothetical protein NC653_014374 [Populus alba x Populus x berolinensis]|uniref:U-box domain-containing protein n=1 Tax=Populus alba x Populus x berolinensis TaxID=444605 RepID=A0AAD6QWS7_9ROSI|nr:hypothetical protein NC653_014374 [Populus alba x Populus x berolinensis]
MDPVTGMVDKAVALLANLSTISEGRMAIAKAGGIPLLVEVVESGSQRGKENAASILMQLCLNSPKFCTLVLQEGAVPPLVALSQSGTPRAKEKAQQLLSHFRSQREGSAGKVCLVYLLCIKMIHWEIFFHVSLVELEALHQCLPAEYVLDVRRY